MDRILTQQLFGINHPATPQPGLARPSLQSRIAEHPQAIDLAVKARPDLVQGHGASGAAI